MRRLRLLIVLAGCTPTSEAPVEPLIEVEAPALLPPTKLGVAEPSTPTLLSPVAFREGRIELAAWADQPYALIDGEPIPLRAGQAVEREPALALGLGPDKRSFAGSHELVAFGGSLGADPSAHLVYAEHFERASSAYFGYARADDRWTPIAWPSRVVSPEPRIETHYAALVATGGALLGLRRPTIRSELWDYGDEEDEDDPLMQARLHKLGRELARAPRGFVVLSGSLPKVPKLPKGWDASDVISTPSGELVALGFRHRISFDDEPGPARVLSWAAGETEATITELPGLDDPSILDLGIWASGDALLIGGLRDLPGADDRPYLASREIGGSWTELELPARARERVASAARTPGGELWIVTGARNYASSRPCPCLWRKPIDDAWELVVLEPVELFFDAEPRWAHVLAEQTWIEVPPGSPPPRYPAALEVLAAGDAIWVSAELGPSYPSAREPVFADPRTVLFSSVPVETPRELIAVDQLFDERTDRQVAHANFKPGSDDCRTFFMVITDNPDGDGLDHFEQLLAKRDALAKRAYLEREDGWASASMIYVGELDGRAQLVIEASAWNPKSALALADELAQVLGRPLALDCRPRRMIRAITRLQ
ncbi:MAG: hypothetical protein R6X02_10270 [Enhygromyxa sp.]